MGKSSQSSVEKKKKALLHSLFYDVNQPSAYSGKETVYRAARRILPTIKRDEVNTWFEEQLPYTLHKPTRLKFPRNKTIALAIDEQWQADLCDMQSLARHNDGKRYILTCICIFSKYAWAETLKQKTSSEIIAALTRIFASDRKPKRLQTDAGSEFTNANVQAFLRKHNVGFFTTNSEQKASIVERFNRTLKTRMFKFFTSENTYRYVDVLQKLVDGYNASYHSSIKMQPRHVKRVHQTLIRQRLYGEKKRATSTRVKTYKYPIGAWVRISKQRRVFVKGYLPNWSEEIFVVHQRVRGHVPVYYLQDLHGEPVSGAFYEPELQRVREPDEYRVEKVLRSRNIGSTKEYFVKWKGYDKSFNSWVRDIRKL